MRLHSCPERNSRSYGLRRTPEHWVELPTLAHTRFHNRSPATPPDHHASRGADPVPYQTRNGAVLRFALTLAPGPHHVGVHYMALPTTYDGSNPARLWQVGYVLAPARQWASFGGLALTVQVPHGWLAATSPSLQRSGDTLRATFNSVPADSLGVTAEYPAPPPPADFTVLALAGGLVLAAVAGWIAGGWLGRRHRTSAWVLPLSIFAGAAVAAGVVLTGLAALVTGVPDDQLSRTFNYGRGTLSLGMAILALCGGIVLCQLAAAWQHHRSQRAASLTTAPRP